MAWLRPILKLKVRHLLEVSAIAGHHNTVIFQGDRSNGQIHLAYSRQLAPQIKVSLDGARREWQYPDVFRGFRHLK
jgi:hypothetical protein